MSVPATTPADPRRPVGQRGAAGPQVERQAGRINEERDGRGGGDERLATEIEAKERCRSDAALVPDESTEQARECPGQPCRPACQTHPGGPAGQLAETGEEEKAAEQGRQPRAPGRTVEQRSRETAGSARDAEAPEHAAVGPDAQPSEPERRADGVRYCHGGDREPDVERHGEDGRQQAADAEPGHRRHCASHGRDEEDQRLVHRASAPSKHVTP
jgi:hypothetical protein